MAGEKKRRRLRRTRYVETLNQSQIHPTTPPQATLDQPSISIDTDRNLDLDLRQTGSRSIDWKRWAILTMLITYRQWHRGSPQRYWRDGNTNSN